MARDTVTEDSRLSLREFERSQNEDVRRELVRGRVVQEPPAGFQHGRLASRLDTVLRRFAEEHELGEVVGAETGFVLAEDPPTVRAPDVAFVAGETLPGGELPQGFARLAPDLVVEIVSPTSTASALHEKVLDYLDAGSRMVWVVEPGTQTVTVYGSREEVRVLDVSDELDGGEVLPGFRLGVGEIFRR